MFSFFFFQAEDGIRDLYVTGVQTCALPISVRNERGTAEFVCARDGSCTKHDGRSAVFRNTTWSSATRDRGRSEERRVGKECRSRWSPYPEKKKEATASEAGVTEQTDTAVV